MNENKKEIIFSGAAYAISYQIGIIKYLIEIFGE